MPVVAARRTFCRVETRQLSLIVAVVDCPPVKVVLATVNEVNTGRHAAWAEGVATVAGTTTDAISTAPASSLATVRDM